jgi:hypothetical protein
MATVSSRNHGGLPKPVRIANPFDSDDDEPTTSTISSRSGGYTNPFDDDVNAKGHTKSKTASAKSSNPFDDDDSPAKQKKQTGRGNKIRSGSNSNQTKSTSSHDASNPFNDGYEVTSKPTSKPKSRGETILNDGSLFDEEEKAAKPVKERRSTTRAFASKIVDSGARIKESASSSLSSVKLPSAKMPSALMGYGGDTTEPKKGKAKHQANQKDLYGEPEPGYVSTQNNYFSQSDQSNFNNQTVEELEQYAVKKSQDTTSSIRNAIRIAKDTEGVASTTLETLHAQGEQIRRTHDTAVRVDEELGRVS